MSENWLLVLGANSDIAIATAHIFARHGWSVHLASRNLQELDKEAANISLRYNVDACTHFFDATQYALHMEFYNTLRPKPRGVILAFGTLGNQVDLQHDFSLAKLTIDTNFTGAVSILEIIAEDLERRKDGFIVAISSVAGDRGRASNYIYGSTKAGLSAYLSGLRHRLFRCKVPVLTVKPGFVQTKMTAGLNLPSRITAKPEDVANAIYNGVQKRKNTIYVLPVWKLIMLIINLIPESIFKRTHL